jgi:mono/diheme cytochrome c family protein
MPRAALAAVVVLLVTGAGCGGNNTEGAETSVAAVCSDSGFTEAVSPRLVDLDKAVIRVDAGHGDIARLDAAAPGLVAAADAVHATAQNTTPCNRALLLGDKKLLVATRSLSRAGHELAKLTVAANRGNDYSSFQSRFLSSFYAGTGALQVVLAALRSAGVPPLVKATDGKGVFVDAGCSTCHTLAAVGASGTVGPSLDELEPSKRAVVEAVRNGQGVMPSFNSLLTAEQIQAVAAFVNRNAGK